MTPIGKGIPRVESKAKVTGASLYTFDLQPAEIGATKPILHGAVILSSIARGHISAMDTSAAEQAPGVCLVLTHHNMLPQAEWGPLNANVRFARAQPVFRDNRVRYFGEPVAFVVAESFECARSAAMSIRVQYEEEQARIVLDSEHGIDPAPLHGGQSSDSLVGDFDAAFTAAEHHIDVQYETPYQNHAAIELQASIAIWDGDHLTVHTPAQITSATRTGLARTLNLPEDRVRVVARLIGGGFGGKLPYFADAVLCAVASRQLQQPVKFSFTRQQMFTATTHRSAVSHRVRLGVTAGGRITAISHDAISQTASFDNYVDGSTAGAKGLYGARAIRTTQRIVRLDLPRSDSMRSPGDANGSMALECAIDEAAHACGQDPVAFRILNDTPVNPTTGKPYSSRHLVASLKEGSRRFGWMQRRRRREKNWLIGQGVASAMRDNLVRPSAAQVTLTPAGQLVVRLDMTDPGTGTITILTQIASETVGLPMEKVTIMLGDTDFPKTSGSGGSFGAESAGSAVYEACVALRHRLDEMAKGRDGSPETILRLVREAGGMTAEGKITPGDETKHYSEASFGAQFAEVAVNVHTGETRVKRMLGVFACGRIINERTARSQALGGMIWGLSSALIEANTVDHRGQMAMRDLANYHVPVLADIQNIEAVLLPETEPVANPLGMKGIGEVGINGAAAAIANAVFDATGARIRQFPITLDRILPALPPLA
ncbi:xanthine dehydrogenase family protein molybdopterin-binding subunit [Gluconobacter morbifer]|uniref:Aldehyde oxidase/xanthine dehydrogenase a/b hammerhead domain-containing protein n=1 Tax=Gluconobacter morbifer G707 TaxID=1088869 RepID=G6XH98_9PROT|nr:xanthine dehydrogenase family protein molybdopterin-binding subunit [Gluconobacter morbifer]EHH69556.1 hypothetical protein GMO_08640 [Gluconobacter morbifer G707]